MHVWYKANIIKDSLIRIDLLKELIISVYLILERTK
jgi:hypothetical protein